VLAAASPAGSWVALCQPRRDTDGDGRLGVSVGPHGVLQGDALDPHLILPSGKQIPFDELADFSPDGRWLLLRRGEQVTTLVDTASETETELPVAGLDVRADRSSFRPHRTLRFDPQSQRLLYVQATEGTQQVVVRHLEGGTEARIDPGEGELWRAEFDPTGSRIVLHMLVDDTNGNGRLDWPVPPTAVNRWRCQGPVPHLSGWPGRGDAVVTKIADPAGGIAQPVIGLATLLGETWVTRDSDDALRLQGAGVSEPLTPSKCAARVLLADPGRQLLLVGCTGAEQVRPPLELVGRGFRKPLDLTTAPMGSDAWPTAAKTPRFVPLRAGSANVAIDLQERRVIDVGADRLVLAAHEGRLLFSERGRLGLYDLPGGSVRDLQTHVVRAEQILQRGRYVAVGRLLIDLEAGAVAGHFEREPLALSVSGTGLLAEQPPSADALPTGPLAWQAAR